MLDSRQPRAEVLTRHGEDWTYDALSVPTDTISLAAGDTVLTLAELYEGLLPFSIDPERQ